MTDIVAYFLGLNVDFSHYPFFSTEELYINLADSRVPSLHIVNCQSCGTILLVAYSIDFVSGFPPKRSNQS